MKTDLPKNVHLLTLEPWKKNSILVRFEHIFAKDESKEYSRPVSFDFKDVLQGLKVASMRETTLGANQWLNEVDRLQFEAKTEATSNEVSDSTEYELNEIDDQLDSEAEDDSTDFKVTLKPMEIRTFVVKLK